MSGARTPIMSSNPQYLRAKRAIWWDQGRAVAMSLGTVFVRPGRAALRANVAGRIGNPLSPAKSACIGLGSSASRLPGCG